MGNQYSGRFKRNPLRRYNSYYFRRIPAERNSFEVLGESEPVAIMRITTGQVKLIYHLLQPLTTGDLLALLELISLDGWKRNIINEQNESAYQQSSEAGGGAVRKRSAVGC